ncbi:NAD(P)/FAD-dependent oxidoreductase [Sphingomonas aracearum]|uniref:NADH:ubiquinone reductase (non-electrogenic) n=1 Tax=Sphingomonas aracearum TaxID=2283317 RepID=A0A369W579_9SPHN|nr:NAD(P)/FAD-dependent oxidoreductase [Sphingomonas aracearum]RDE07231.1 NAD(P)/FAD-dependent oxidoreductase [Sphingomonas aracearum]
MPDHSPRRRRIVIVGGGFGGLACARALAGAEVDVTLVDRRNHHLFQPLLYQVSTAALSPADIAVPIRRVLSRAKNVEVLLAEVAGVDVAEKRVRLADGGALPYDQLVLATGSVYNYFGHSDWAETAPAPKTLASARTIRARLLRAFEDAERSDDPDERRRLLTFVVVGGGPTGVEMAGTVAELARHTLSGDFRRIDPAQARVVLVEAGPKLLAAFPEELARYAARALERLGVEVRLGCGVEAIDEAGVQLHGERLPAATVIWGAGTRAADGANWLGGTEDRGGRIRVAANMAVEKQEDIFALGDVALLEQDGAPLPGLAQVAQQQGRFLGKELRTRAVPRAFRYRSKGDTAVIGRHAAVYTWGKWRLKGLPAWLLWALVHVYLLIGFERRTLVMIQWAWRYLTFERGARLID